MVLKVSPSDFGSARHSLAHLPAVKKGHKTAHGLTLLTHRNLSRCDFGSRQSDGYDRQIERDLILLGVVEGSPSFHVIAFLTFLDGVKYYFGAAPGEVPRDLYKLTPGILLMAIIFPG